MAERKETVTLNMTNGETKNLEGKTVIIFAIDDAEALIEGKKGIGVHVVTASEKIHSHIFADVIGSIVSSLVEKTYQEQPMLTAYQLSSIAYYLSEQCGKINKNICDSVDDEKELDDMVEGLLQQLFG